MKRENLKTLVKRSWQPWIVESTGKWYTGYDQTNYYERQTGEKVKTSKYPHEVRQLKLTPRYTITGRSSANMIFEDEQGFEYIMTLKGGFDLVKQLISKTIECDGEYLICEFVQVKKGANIFIEALED
ncbi:MAG: hypothetical protein GOVbin1096_100 [Prokaryotic dsDNA virus sp.]|jgi:hypothetical protein|nr:MAG: hypothetical protein GOVbin1096_100 [Prokaryotic dsDNA virus sp.]|tara:strand:+ start:21621 stop:22004 length:384 start_codon:yes stop_codon:yes gene_type:complete